MDGKRRASAELHVGTNSSAWVATLRVEAEANVPALPCLASTTLQGHALSPVAEAYRLNVAQVQSLVNGQLLSKRDALMQQHARLSARIGEVTAQRAALERSVAVSQRQFEARNKYAHGSTHVRTRAGRRMQLHGAMHTGSLNEST